MTVHYRAFFSESRFSGDQRRVHDFLIALNQEEVREPGFLWGRWEWMFSHPMLDREHLGHIGIWEDDGDIVAVATYESGLGDAWFFVHPAYSRLKGDMIAHALQKLSREGTLRLRIPDSDQALQELAARAGFVPTQDREETAILPIASTSLGYTLPEGYRIATLAEDPELIRYNRVMWRGFNHEGEPPVTPDELAGRKQEVSGPHVQLDLKVAVQAPNGKFVSYCGMWYLPGTDYALVEPVATDPDYRRMGLGRAAVLEGVRRCAALGAKFAYVGSSQTFYYRIGFRPSATDTWWTLVR
ncbi:GNAT family N-acetyltransferase [Gorillibacterium sp. CAU 1737]|uniref:GNAT family N-acetyltransferase n=1 Tax=Gorillibacterium sp. CAU 1737 TaxID=3140362 RepID=UPI003260550B